jgi:xylulokinase
LMRATGLTAIREVRVSGGGARSALWRQILADVLDVELVRVNITEGAAYGAALLAATGTGVFADVGSACAATIHATGSAAPGAASATYQELYPLYRALYPALRPTFDAVARIAARL